MRPEKFEEPDAADGEALPKSIMGALTENKFSAATADIENEQAPVVQSLIAGHSGKHPVRLLFARDYFDAQPGGSTNGAQQFVRIPGVARGAGGDGANGFSFVIPCHGNELRDRRGGAGDGDGLKDMGVVESGAEAGLLAAFLNRENDPFGHISDEQLDGIGADINHRSAA